MEPDTAQSKFQFAGARSRLDEKMKKWEGTPVIIPLPEGLAAPTRKTTFKQPTNGTKKSRNYRKKEKEPDLEEIRADGKSEEKNTAPNKQNGATTSQDTLRIKRKRDEAPLDLFVLEQERKKVKKPLSSLVEKFAALDTNIDNDLQQLRMEEKEESKQKKIEERKLFRFAYTITDAEKIKKNMRGARKISGQVSRQKAVDELRKGDQKKKEEDEEFVIDVYLRDNKPADTKELEQARVIRLESFDEELVHENEYDKDSADDDEDFDAEDHPWNDYPEEEESPVEFSDDSDGEEGELRAGTQLSSDDEGFRPYEYSSDEEDYDKYAYDDGATSD